MSSSALSFFDDSNSKFVKDPYITFLVVLNVQERLEDIAMQKLSPGKNQAYFFAAEFQSETKMKLFEVQRYSWHLVEVLEINGLTGEINWINKNPLSRRSNLQGVSIRGCVTTGTPKLFESVNGHMKGFFGEILSVFETKFNFTLDPIPFTYDYGTKLSNGSWTGQLKKLIHNELDFSKFPELHRYKKMETNLVLLKVPLDFTKLPERLEVADGGYGIFKSTPKLFYKVSYYESNQWYGILKTFSVESWIVIGSTNLVFILVVISVNRMSGKDMKVSSIGAVFRAFLGSSFDSESLAGKFKMTKVMLIFTMSLSSGLLFWNFCGIFTSSLAVQKSSAPFKSLEEMTQSSNNIKVAISSSGEIFSFLQEWKEMSDRNWKAYHNKIVPCSWPNIVQHLKSKANTATYINDKWFYELNIDGKDAFDFIGFSFNFVN